MTTFEVIGYKKIAKSDKTLFYVSLITEEPKDDLFVGMQTYNGFVSAEHLEKNNISEAKLLGSTCRLFNVKENGSYRSVITFKKG